MKTAYQTNPIDPKKKLNKRATGYNCFPLTFSVQCRSVCFSSIQQKKTKKKTDKIHSLCAFQIVTIIWSLSCCRCMFMIYFLLSLKISISLKSNLIFIFLFVLLLIMFFCWHSPSLAVFFMVSVLLRWSESPRNKIVQS